MTATKSASTLIATGTSNLSGNTTSGTVDLTTKYGAFITGLLTNGATGPATAPAAYVEVSVDNVNWKQVYVVLGDLNANSVTPFSYDVSIKAMYARVRVTGNTGQTITCEAFAHVLLT